MRDPAKLLEMDILRWNIGKDVLAVNAEIVLFSLIRTIGTRIVRRE
jgi:hypothetical protein